MNDIETSYLKAAGIGYLTNNPADVALRQAASQPRQDQDEPPELTTRSVMHPEHGTVKGAVKEQGQRAKDIAIGAYANTLDATAHFWRVIDGAAEKIAETTSTDKGGIFKSLADSAEHWADHYHGKVRFKDFATNVTTGILGSGPGIAMFAMGPVWAGLEGFTEDGIKGAVVGTTRRWFAGRVFGALHEDPNMISRMATGSAFFTSEAAAAGERDPGKLAEAATIGAAFTAKGKSPEYFKPTEGQKLEATDFVKELDRAVEAGEIAPETAQIARSFVLKNIGAGIDSDTTLKVLGDIKIASDEILASEGIRPGTPAIVTGKAATFGEADQLRTMIELYRGNDPTTIIEELFHRDYHRMSLAERKELQQEYDQTEGMVDRPRSGDEWYAQTRTAEFFSTAGRAKGPMARMQEWFRGVVRKVKGMMGNRVDEGWQAFEAYHAKKLPHSILPQSAVVGRSKGFKEVRKSPDFEAGKLGDMEAAARIAQQVWPENRSRQLLKKIGDPEDYVMLTQPSSGRKNVHPEALADRISEHTGIKQIISGTEAFRSLHQFEQKHLSKADRVMRERSYRPMDIEALKEEIGDRKVIVVEDILSSAGSVADFAAELKRNGIDTAAVVAEMGDSRLALDELVAGRFAKAAAAAGLDPEDYYDILTRSEAYQLTRHLNYAAEDRQNEAAEGVRRLSRRRPAPDLEGSGGEQAPGQSGPGKAVPGDGQSAADLQARTGLPDKSRRPKLSHQVRKIDSRITDADRSGSGISAPSDLQPLQERDKYASLNINVTKLDGADIPAVEKLLNEIGEAHFEDLRTHQGGPVTHEQMVKEGKAQAEKLARQTNTPVKAILKEWEKDAEVMYKRATAARTIHLQALRELMQAAEAARGFDATDLNLASYRVALGNFMEIHRAVTGITASHGRALSSFAARVGSDAMESDRMLTRELDAMLNSPGNDRGMIKDMADKLVQLQDMELPPEELMAMIDKTAQGFSKASAKDMVLEAWINGLLSGPQTHAANTISNTLVMATQVPERWLAAQIGRLHGGDKVAAGEAGAMTYGMLAGIKDGFRLAGLAYLKGESSDIVGKVEAPHRAITARNMGLDETSVFGRGVDLLAEHVIRQPGKLLMTEDEFFKTVGYRMELHAQAHRMATAEGFVGKKFARAVQAILDNPPEDVKISSQDAARYVTFTNELGKTGTKLQSWINSHGLLKVIAPFIRTPTNIFKYAFARTPAALVMKSVREDLVAGGARRDLAISRIALGTMLMGLTGSMVASGRITGGGPPDYDERKIWRQENQPYSVKIGNKWHSYQRLEPVGSIIGIAADATEIVINRETIQDVDDALAVGAAAISRQVTSKTFTRGFADFIHAMDDPVRYGETYAERLVGSVVPTGVAQLNRGLNDPYFREVEGVLDAIKARTPWSDNLMPRRGPWGEPIKTEGSLGPDWISPIWTGTPKGEPINEEMIKHHMEMPRLSRTISVDKQPIRLNAKQWDRYQELAGHAYKMKSGRFKGLGLKNALNRFVQTKEYGILGDGPDGGKANAIRNIAIKYKAYSKEQLLKEFPEIVTVARQAAYAQQAAQRAQ